MERGQGKCREVLNKKKDRGAGKVLNQERFLRAATHVEKKVNCWNPKPATARESAAKPSKGKVQRLSRKGVGDKRSRSAFIPGVTGI